MRVPTNDSAAYCRLCRKEFSLSSMGIGSVNRHVGGKFHQAAVERSVPAPGFLLSFFKPASSAASVAPRDDPPAQQENAVRNPHKFVGEVCHCSTLGL